MNASLALASATDRLERHDGSLNSIDLRGKGRLERSDTPTVARSKIRKFATALKHYCRPPPSLRSSHVCQLTYLAFHNHFLDPCELPLLFDALACISSLENFVLFNHDLGDEGVDLLMQALVGTCHNGCNNRDNEKDLVLDNEGSGCVKSSGNLAISKTVHTTFGLKELYLSHCNISSKGASAIAKALDNASSSSIPSGNRLRYLQVLSLGSNRIGEKGAQSLARAFGRYPSLQRMVLHGNKGDTSSPYSPSNNFKSEEGSKTTISHHALIPAGWQQPSSLMNPTNPGLVQLAPTKLAMSIFTPLILPHVQRRWGKDRVLVRPHDLLRKRLREEMYKRDSTFVDSHLEFMPDVLSWIGRDGACCRQTSLHSQVLNFPGGKMICHSSGREHCCACANIHLNDLHEMFLRMPHLIALFRSISI